MRPVLRGMCKYESLIDAGPMMLHDIILMNEAIDVQDENDYRIAQAKG